MTRISARQCAVLIAFTAWGPGPNSTVAEARAFMDTAVAVATAESGLVIDGRPSSTDDWGLWQINKPSHPYAFAQGNQKLYDPAYNTFVAKNIWRAAGNSWSPWSAYNNGSYRRYLGPGARAYDYVKNLSFAELQAAYRAIPRNETQQNTIKDLETENPLGMAIDALPNAVTDFGNKIVTGAKSAGFWVLAIILLIIGVMFLLRDTPIVKSATGLINPVNKAKLLK